MSHKTPEKYLMLAGASLVAMSWAVPVATAQEDNDTQRTLGTVLVTTQKLKNPFRTFRSPFRPSMKKRSKSFSFRVVPTL